MKLRDWLHRDHNEPEGDAPEGFEDNVMLIRDPVTGKIKRLQVEPEKDGEDDAPDA